MSIKSILVPVADAVGVEAALPLALTLAQRLEARLTMVHPTPEPSASLPILADAPAVGVADQLITAMEEQSARIAEQTRAAFDAACSAQGVTPVDDFDAAGFAVRYLGAAGSEAVLIARLGRLHDLIVVPHPSSDDPALTPALGAALLETGRPVMVAPAVAPASIATRVIAAWNGSVEAARALAAAADLVGAATQIVIATAGEANQAAPTAEEAVAYLAAHGIAATAKHLAVDRMEIAEALLNEADRQQADLLVMGAYSHSRLRETILGGVTRDILVNLDRPVLMAH